MIKTTLYGAVAAGALAVAGVTPLAAAPAAKIAPDVQSSKSDVQSVYFYTDDRRYRRHRRHHHYYDNSYYWGPPAPFYGPRYYHW
jgi:hypothetical protein